MPAWIVVVNGARTGMKRDRLFVRNKRGVPTPLYPITLFTDPVHPVSVKIQSIKAKLVFTPDSIRRPLDVGDAALEVADV